MIVDTGYRCPEIQSFGFFPFATSQDYRELLNQSGFSGPMPRIDNRQSGFSGILGKGTFFPNAGNVDALNRMFWCVKSYQLEIQVAEIFSHGFVECQNQFDPGGGSILSNVYCGIGGNLLPAFNGAIPGPDFAIKTLTVQDYCSYNAPTGTFNLNPSGYCPTQNFPANPNITTCVPVNPIQKFNDLLCRKSYFTWVPKQTDWEMFNGGNFTGIKSPYISTFNRFKTSSPLPPPEYDCGFSSPVLDHVYSMFTLSIMDLDGLAYSGNSLRYASQNYFPDFSDRVSPFECLGKSGEALTNSFGEITGYGINAKPSGLFSPILFNGGTGFGEFPLTGHNSAYFPFIHFQLRIKSDPKNDISMCPINNLISNIQLLSGTSSIGSLNIMDFVSGSNASADKYTQVMSIPLYSQDRLTQSQISVTATLRPATFWINAKNQVLY